MPIPSTQVLAQSTESFSEKNWTERPAGPGADRCGTTSKALSQILKFEDFTVKQDPCTLPKAMQASWLMALTEMSSSLFL